MDKLTILRKAEELGNQQQDEEREGEAAVSAPLKEKRGTVRRQRIEQLIRHAHDQGCSSEVGGGRIGGINFRYGSIRYAIMDVDVYGNVKLYVQPHPNKTAKSDQISNTLKENLNNYIQDKFEVEENGVIKKLMKNKKLTCYGHVEAPVEQIPKNVLFDFLEHSVKQIKEIYYAGVRT